MPESIQPSVFGPRRVAVVAIVVMLLAQAAFGIATAERLTVTHDEYWHIPVGLLNWKTGRFDFEPLNPPLIRLWAAAPLLLTSANSPRTEPTSDLARFGDEFLAANPDTFDRWVVISRCAVVLLTVLSGALLARWAWEWHGPLSACLVAWLWSRSPNILAHGSLVTTDLGGTTFWIATLYAVWRFAQRPTPRRAIIAGVILGLAQAAKYTCVLLVPLAIGLWLLERWRRPARSAPMAHGSEMQPLLCRAALGRWAVLLLAAWFSLNAVYLFRGTGSSLRTFEFASQSARAWQQLLGPLAALPVPLPRDYVVGIDRQKAVMESKHAVFLDGELNETGFAHYYLMTLLYKWPHSIHVLLLWAVIQSLCWRTASAWRRRMWCVVPSVLMLAVASLSGMQLGIRYVLPVISLSLLFVSEIAAKWSWPQTRWQPLVVGVLLLIFDPWHSHPEYLAYFNEFAGGTEGGRFHLLDSNLDWGQDLHELQRFVAEHPQVAPLSLAYFGTLPPESVGLDYENPPTRQPRAGWHAVSVNFVKGRPHWTHDGRGGKHSLYPPEDVSYFDFFDPKYRIGASIDLYHLTEADVRRWHETPRTQLQGPTCCTTSSSRKRTFGNEEYLSSAAR